MNGADVSVKVAAILFGLTGFGFGVFCIPAISSVGGGRGVLIIFGFPTYGGGPFERFGVRTTVPLLVAFLIVCILEIIAGWLVWNGQMSGVVLGFILLVPGFVFWWGFALPIPPVLALIRSILVLANLRRFS